MMRIPSFTVAVALLASVSAPAAAQDMDRMATEVFAAAAEGDVARLRQFLSDGYDVNYQRKGSSALSAAVIFKRADAVRFLLSRGADPATTAYDEFVVGFDTPRPLIEVARRSGAPEIVGLLEAASRGNRPAATATPPVQPAAAAPPPAVAERPPAPALPAGAVRWDRPAAYSAGQAALISTNGGLDWRPGAVVRAGAGENDRQYLVADATGQTHFLDWTKVTTLARQPYWTSQFVGDWALFTGMSSVVRTDGRDLYQITEGGMRLPPLQIRADGGYTWVLSDGRRIAGRWTPRPNAPGIVLVQGDKGLDWTVYNATTRSSLDVSGADELRLVNPAAMGSVGSRLGG